MTRDCLSGLDLCGFSSFSNHSASSSADIVDVRGTPLDCSVKASPQFGHTSSTGSFASTCRALADDVDTERRMTGRAKIDAGGQS
jgi:hypothetical protein